MSRQSVRIDSILKQTKSTSNRIGKTVKKNNVKVDPVKIEIKPDPLIPESIKAEEQEQLLTSDSKPSHADMSPMLRQAMSHLTAIDPRFGTLARTYTPRPWCVQELAEPKNHFKSLALSIMSQQVSTAAARSISAKFIALFATPDVIMDHIKLELDPEVPDSAVSSAPANDSISHAAFFPTPAQVATSDTLFLKSAGLSLRKAEYVKGVAQAFVDGVLTDTLFDTASDEEVISHLVALRGLGAWSAEMFLMFALKREDVISMGDIGLQRGMSYWIGKDPRDKSKHNKGAYKYMTAAEMTTLTDTWRPYRSIGSWFMWRVDGPVAVI